MRKRTKLLLVCLTSPIATVYALELGLFLESRGWIEFGGIAGGTQANRRSASRLDLVEGMIKQGIDACPSAHPEIYVQSDGITTGSNRIFPLAGVSRVTTVFCHNGKEHLTYLSDQHGFNNPANAWNTGSPDMVLVGDSFVHGECVGPGQDVASLLKEQTGYSVLNLGYRGNGPLIELAVLTEYAAPLEPGRTGRPASEPPMSDGSPPLQVRAASQPS